MIKFLGRGSAFADENNSAFFTEGGRMILIDCPMTAFHKIKRMSLDNINAIDIIVTHTHSDHVSGIAMLIDFMWFVKKIPITVVAPTVEVKNDLHYFINILDGCSDDWYSMLTIDEYKELKIEAIPTSHTEQLAGKCFGYHIELNGKDIVYTGDTNTIEPFIPFIHEGCTLYMECSLFRSPVHLQIDDMLPFIKEQSDNGVKIFLMHLDDETAIEEKIRGTSAELAPLYKEDTPMTNETLDKIYDITDTLYKNTCNNEEQDHNAIFGYLTELGKTIVGADRASFWKWDKRRHELWTTAATGIDRIVIPDNTGLVGKALRQKKALIVNDPYSDPDFNKDIDTKTGYRTKSVPVLPVADVNGDFIGALQLINKNGDKGFDPEIDPKKLSLAALVCGIALESEIFLEDSHHDRLTGLKNRMGFYYDFAKKYKDYLISGSDLTMCVFICDIDKFKRVNDTYGHNAGDDVLEFTSHLIESTCSDKDSVYRWGGEEFVMIMRDTDLEGAVKKAEEIRVKLMNSDIEADGNTLKCTLSFGCARFDPDKSIEENISQADERLYTAKETGRNKVCWE